MRRIRHCRQSVLEKLKGRVTQELANIAELISFDVATCNARSPFSPRAGNIVSWALLSFGGILLNGLDVGTILGRNGDANCYYRQLRKVQTGEAAAAPIYYVSAGVCTCWFSNWQTSPKEGICPCHYRKPTEAKRKKISFAGLLLHPTSTECTRHPLLAKTLVSRLRQHKIHRLPRSKQIVTRCHLNDFRW